MKKKYLQNTISSLLLLVLSVVSLLTWAQDSTVSSHKIVTTTTTTTNQFEMQPWMWIVGGIVALLIIIGLFSGGVNKEVTKTTIIKDNRN